VLVVVVISLNMSDLSEENNPVSLLVVSIEKTLPECLWSV